MIKIPKNHKGFTAVEGLLTVLILVVIGGVGYMVYHNNHKAKTVAASTTTTKTSTTSSAKSTAPANPYAGWKTYTASDGTSFQYPADWTLASPSASYVTVSSPVDNATGLEYQLSYGPALNRSQVLNDNVVSSTALGTTLAKPLYMSTLDFNDTNGSDIDGLFVTDANLSIGASANPTSVGFSPNNGSGVIGFEAVLQPPSYQNNGGEKLSVYQGNQYYQTVINIFKSLK